jgi:hypothetical protein
MLQSTTYVAAVVYTTTKSSKCGAESSSKTIGRCWMSAPGHVTTAGVTRHLAANRNHVLQKLDTWIELNRNVRKTMFTPLLILSADCPYDLVSTYGISTIRCWYSEMILWIFSISLYDARHISQCTPRNILQVTGVQKTRYGVAGVTLEGRRKGPRVAFCELSLKWTASFIFD